MKQNLFGRILGKMKIFVQDFVTIKTGKTGVSFTVFLLLERLQIPIPIFFKYQDTRTDSLQFCPSYGKWKYLESDHWYGIAIFSRLKELAHRLGSKGDRDILIFLFSWPRARLATLPGSIFCMTKQDTYSRDMGKNCAFRSDGGRRVLVK